MMHHRRPALTEVRVGGRQVRGAAGTGRAGGHAGTPDTRAHEALRSLNPRVA